MYGKRNSETKVDFLKFDYDNNLIHDGENQIGRISIFLWIKEPSKIFSCPCISCRNDKKKTEEGL
jgi:hypothetical protein